MSAFDPKRTSRPSQVRFLTFLGHRVTDYAVTHNAEHLPADVLGLATGGQHNEAARIHCTCWQWSGLAAGCVGAAANAGHWIPQRWNDERLRAVCRGM